MIDFKHILVPIDFEPSAEEALELAVDLAGTYDASLTLVHAYEVPSYVYPGVALAVPELRAPIEKAAREHLQAVLTRTQARRPGAKAVLREGRAVPEILAALAEVHADLVVMGTHGRQGVGHALLGSVAEKIVRVAPVPVITVRASRS